jgi:cob(I)alamin adenosyltransferase
MRIVTRTGDNGTTSLYGGGRVSKDNVRIETCGALDEVSSFLGVAKSLLRDRKTKAVINCIQKELIVLCSEVASISTTTKKLKNRINSSSVSVLEKEICSLENKRDMRFRSFCLQGANHVSSALDVARAVTRRAERRCVAMSRKKMLKNRDIIVYLNRLSDLLYLLARSNEKKK